jgi:hypothetical protein
MRFARPSLKKIVLTLVVLALAVGGVLGLLAYTFERKFHPVPPAANFPAPKDRAEAMRQDIEQLGNFPRLDNAFSPEARAKFEEGRQDLLARAATLTPAMLEMEVTRLVALAQNGHTTVGRKLRRLQRVPLRLMWFEEGIFVVRTPAAQSRLLGMQVVSVNGKTPDEMLATFLKYSGGPAEHAKSTTPLYLESPTALSGVWPDMPGDRATYVLRDAQGASETVTFEAMPTDPKASYIDPTRDLAPQRLAKESEPWANLLSAMPDLPLALRDPDASVHVAKLDEGKGFYIHIIQTVGDERGALDAQLAAILANLEPASLRYAILDLRFNGGGDYTTTLKFTHELPKRIAADGRLLILSDNATFSAAIVTLARAKFFGGARATVLGERVGDRERFWAESAAPLELPNSKILVFSATGYHDWNEGCGWKDLTTCFWLNFFYDVPAGDLGPAKPMPWRFADYRAGVDTVLEEALRQGRSVISLPPAPPTAPKAP